MKSLKRHRSLSQGFRNLKKGWRKHLPAIIACCLLVAALTALTIVTADTVSRTGAVEKTVQRQEVTVIKSFCSKGITEKCKKKAYTLIRGCLSYPPCAILLKRGPAALKNFPLNPDKIPASALKESRHESVDSVGGADHDQSSSGGAPPEGEVVGPPAPQPPESGSGYNPPKNPPSSNSPTPGNPSPDGVQITPPGPVLPPVQIPKLPPVPPVTIPETPSVHPLPEVTPPQIPKGPPEGVEIPGKGILPSMIEGAGKTLRTLLVRFVR